MADTSKIIDPDNQAGTDYTSLSAWEAWAQSQGSSGDTNTAQCRCDSDGSASADTTYVDFNGWTAGVKAAVTAMSGQTAKSKWDATRYRHDSAGTSSGSMISRVPLTLTGIQMRSSYNSSSNTALNQITQGPLVVSKCYIVHTVGYAASINLSTLVATFKNSILYGPGSYCLVTTSYSELYIYNCVIRGGMTGSITGKTNVCKNTYVDKWYNTGHWGTANNNATAFSSGAGADCKLNVTRTSEFTDPDNATVLSQDYSVKATSTNILDCGADLTGTIETTDIDGNDRGATWDIGAAEYVAPAAGGCPKQFMYYESQRRLR